MTSDDSLFRAKNANQFESPDLTSQNIDKIAALFPNCVTEMRDENGKLKHAVNFEMLKQMLSPDVVDGDECYEFTWVGKKAAIVEANKPIRKTLRPCPAESKDWDTTENLYIEGDNLEVLKLLQEAYLGKVKMIYIDPPYNTGNDFIYADDFMRSQEEENEQMGMYADEYDQKNLEEMVSNIKEDRTDLDLLFGCLLDWGLPLSLPYKSEQIDGCTVHTYNDGDLIACFDKNIPENVVKEIAKRKPLRAVFRDSSFADSPSKINVFEIFKLCMPEDANDISKRVRVI